MVEPKDMKCEFFCICIPDTSSFVSYVDESRFETTQNLLTAKWFDFLKDADEAIRNIHTGCVVLLVSMDIKFKHS
jgi:hypothetical protein